jgi:hypothetical protein
VIKLLLLVLRHNKRIGYGMIAVHCVTFCWGYELLHDYLQPQASAPLMLANLLLPQQPGLLLVG